MDPRTSETRYLILPLISGMCWGTAGIFVRTLGDAGLNNLTIIYSRSLVALLVSLLLILFTDLKKLRVKPRDLPLLFSIGASGIIILSFCYNEAVLRTSLPLSSVLLSLAPGAVLFLSALLFGEKLTFRKCVCMALAIFGCVLLSGLLDSGGNLRWDTAGFFFGLASAAASAAYTLLSRAAAGRGYGPMTLYFYSFIFVSIVLTPFADIPAITGFFLSSPAKSGLILFLQAVWSSMLPAMLYTLAVVRAKQETGRIAILSAGAEPAAALLAGLLLYGEIPSLPGFIGMIITVGSLIALLR